MMSYDAYDLELLQCDLPNLEDTHLESCREDERGATVLEAALVLPAFFLLLLGIFEFGVIYSTYQTMVGAVREGARYAVTPDPNSTPNPYSLPQNTDVATQVCNKIQAGVGGVGDISACKGGVPSTIATGTCPSASGTQPTLTTDNVYVGQCTITVNIPPTGAEGTETYIQVAVRRNVQLFWAWQFPLTATAVMRSEGN